MNSEEAERNDWRSGVEVDGLSYPPHDTHSLAILVSIQPWAGKGQEQL